MFLDLAAELLSAGYRVRFRATGRSMQPAIRHGETLIIERVEPTAIEAGDILLCRHRQRPIAHRVVAIRKEGDTVAALVLRGDAKAECDSPVKPEHVLGRVVATETSDNDGIVLYLLSWLPRPWRHHFVAPRAIRQM